MGAWVALAVALAGATTIAVVSLAYRKIGGISGDVLGAAEQLGEAAVLIAIAAAADTGRLPWWHWTATAAARQWRGTRQMNQSQFHHTLLT